MVGAAGFEPAAHLNPIQVRYLAALRPVKVIIANTYEFGESTNEFMTS